MGLCCIFPAGNLTDQKQLVTDSPSSIVLQVPGSLCGDVY